MHSTPASRLMHNSHQDSEANEQSQNTRPPVRVEQAEAYAHSRNQCLFFRCTTTAKDPTKKPTVQYYFHAKAAHSALDHCLYEGSGPFNLAHFVAKDNTRPYQYLHEREWLPVLFSKPPALTSWTYQAVPTRYFGTHHANPRSIAEINAILDERRTTREASRLQQRARVPTPVQPSQDQDQEEDTEPSSLDSLPDGVAEAIAANAVAEESLASTTTLPTGAMANQNQELWAEFQAFLTFRQQRGQGTGPATAANITTARASDVPDPFDDHTGRNTVPQTPTNDPRVLEAGKLLARIDSLSEAIKWREAAHAANMECFPLRVGPLQSPSGDRFSPDIADRLNEAISECATRCSTVILDEQRQVLRTLQDEKDALAVGWVRNNEERLAIQDVRRLNSRAVTRRAVPTVPLVGPTPYFLRATDLQPTIQPNWDIIRQQSTGQRRSRSRSRTRSGSQSGRAGDRSRSSSRTDDTRYTGPDNNYNRGNGRSVRFQRRAGRR